MQLHCTGGNLFCASFIESLLPDIDLCQLDTAERRFQIGWCSGVIRDECVFCKATRVEATHTPWGSAMTGTFLNFRKT